MGHDDLLEGFNFEIVFCLISSPCGLVTVSLDELGGLEANLFPF